MNVLAIDDNEVSLRIYERMIKQQLGCDAHAFTSAREALYRAPKLDIDLVIVDYMMPDIDGLEFIRRFRVIPGKDGVPVVMITLTQDRDVRHKALELGANDFLIKPVDPTEFMGRAKSMLALRSAQRKLADRAALLADEVKAATAEIRERQLETIFRLSRAAEYRDTETGMHIMRIGHYCETIARGAGLPPDLQELLLIAAPMHDIGKVAIPDEILRKPGKLEPAEYEIMKTHTTIGHEILRGSSSTLLIVAAEIALTHHEKYDGTGYPNGLAGEAIPLVGRICAISDVFDALVSERPYKPAWPLDSALAEIRGCAGTHFDPKLVDAFMFVLGEILSLKERYADSGRSTDNLLTRPAAR